MLRSKSNTNSDRRAEQSFKEILRSLSTIEGTLRLVRSAGCIGKTRDLFMKAKSSMRSIKKDIGNFSLYCRDNNKSFDHQLTKLKDAYQTCISIIEEIDLFIKREAVEDVGVKDGARIGLQPPDQAGQCVLCCT